MLQIMEQNKRLTEKNTKKINKSPLFFEGAFFIFFLHVPPTFALKKFPQ